MRAITLILILLLLLTTACVKEAQPAGGGGAIGIVQITILPPTGENQTPTTPTETNVQGNPATS